MKKLVLSTVAAAMVATSASAVTVGVGVDLMTSVANPLTAASTGTTMGSTPAVRVAIDGVVPGLRLEPTFAYMNATNDATGATTETYTSFGFNAYYDIAGAISAGLVTNFGTISSDATGNVDTSVSTIGVVLKGEVELGKGLTVASELGFASTSTVAGSAYGGDGTVTFSQLAPVTSVTLRYFF